MKNCVSSRCLINPHMNIHTIEIRGTDVSDSQWMDRTLPLIGSSPASSIYGIHLIGPFPSKMHSSVRSGAILILPSRALPFWHSDAVLKEGVHSINTREISNRPT